MKKYIEIPKIKVSYVSDIDVNTSLNVATAEEAYEAFMSVWDISTIEYVEDFYMLHLNRTNYVLGISHISRGGIGGTVVDAKIVFGHALLTASSAIIFAHNHPSGSCSPSHPDIELTLKLKKAAEALDIKLLDHLIITKDRYYSMADKGDIDFFNKEK